MSLVERALKKLQESRGTVPGAVAGSQAPAALRPTPAVPLSAAPVVPEYRSAAQQPVPQQGKESAPKRVVAVDRNALRTMELMPPVAFERQIASQYQHIKRSLIAIALGKSGDPIPNGRLIMLASALAGEGKTFTSINLALSMALEKDIEILLVDADVAKPHLTRIFGLQSEPGLLDLLGDGTLYPESLILPTDVAGLSMLPAGKQRANATELLASARMEEVIALLGGTDGRRIVLFDSPPLLLSTESAAIAGVIGQVVMVVRAQSTSRKAVADAIDIVGEKKPISLILNQSESPATSGYYGYGSYNESPPNAAEQ